MKKLFILPFILFCFCVKAQERINEAQPKIISSIKTIDQFTGWMKNDIGKWVSGNKAIPFYEHSHTVLKFCEELIKIEWCRIEYDGKSYLCFSKFSIFKFEKWNRINTQYVCDFSLISDTTLSNDIFQTIGETKNILIHTIAYGDISSFEQITWKQVLIELKKVIKETNSNIDDSDETNSNIDHKGFNFQYRVSKSQNIQFTIGPSSISRCEVGYPDLNNSYYETTLSNMKSFLSTILRRMAQE